MKIHSPILAHAEPEGTSPSAARELIEGAEANVLGAEKHAALEKIEPGIDNWIRANTLPLSIAALSLILFLIVFYLRRKKA